MEFELETSIAVLQTTPSILQAWLGHLPPEWVLANEGEGTWSPFDVVGHLIHGEKTDWIPRAVIILSDRQKQGIRAVRSIRDVHGRQGEVYAGSSRCLLWASSGIH